MNTSRFIRELKSYQGSNVFNPYTDICPVYDRYNASAIRSKNLSNILNSLQTNTVDSIWIGRDLGHRGGRRTGLALTDEARFEQAKHFWKAEINRATKGEAFAERTALNIWNFLEKSNENIFTWNVFPFHPYEENKPLSNRSHTSKERDYGLSVLESIISLLQPKRIVAIGNDAYTNAAKVFNHLPIYKVRHPSYGGEKDFRKQMSKLYSLR
ncbi:uracil-DNA glycosylase [Pseudoteredinibacter isoporae]|uniref:uracil-DNA glycosylase n=1 Tax=Pseudoteredinibacter isoporae TaxID=570281 RepID=UPI0031052F7F